MYNGKRLSTNYFVVWIQLRCPSQQSNCGVAVAFVDKTLYNNTMHTHTHCFWMLIYLFTYYIIRTYGVLWKSLKSE